MKESFQATRQSFVPSSHFMRRAAQRNISPKDVAMAIKHGQRLHRTGIQFYFLRRRDIPDNSPHNFGHLHGLTVLVAPNGTLITAYKDSRGLRKLKRKSKRRAQPRGTAGKILIQEEVVHEEVPSTARERSATGPLPSEPRDR